MQDEDEGLAVCLRQQNRSYSPGDKAHYRQGRPHWPYRLRVDQQRLMPVYSWILLAIALFLFWYPAWDDDRRRMRRNERESESKRLDIIIKYGIDPREIEISDLNEFMHWRQHGRGTPYG